jgi:hypothetical protein
MLPHVELEALLLTLEEAISLAVSGHLVDGYDCLLGGLHVAEECSEAGMPWAGELARRYQEALEVYAVRYGVRFG